MINKEQFNKACDEKQEQLSRRLYMKTRDERQRKLRVIREYFGYTVEELAKEIGVSAKTIYRYETHSFKKNTDEIMKCVIWYNESLINMMNDNIYFVDLEV